MPAPELEYQGVTFTSSWTDKLLTLEIDATHRTGDWASAASIGALQLKDIGRLDNVTLTSAPGGAASWTLSSNELNAHGCGGRRAHRRQPVLLGRPQGQQPAVGEYSAGAGAGAADLRDDAGWLGGLAVMGAMARRRTVMK